MANLKGFKAVITAGGIGTRLLPFSKEIPKEMVPIITRNADDAPVVKPIVQAIFEQLYESHIRDFYVIVGRGKRAIEDHFTPDEGFLELLHRKKKKGDELVRFYDKMKASNLVFVNQPEPSGFGDAVLKASPYVENDFLVYAGDTYIISKNATYLDRLKIAHAELRSDVTILLQSVMDPHQYGVALGKDLSGGILKIKKVVEKPEHFVSNLAIMPIYLFNESIFEALRKTRKGKGGELQLTDAIQLLIDDGKKVSGVKLAKDEVRLDIGSPETLMDTLSLSSRAIGFK